MGALRRTIDLTDRHGCRPQPLCGVKRVVWRRILLVWSELNALLGSECTRNDGSGIPICQTLLEAFTKNEVEALKRVSYDLFGYPLISYATRGMIELGGE